jgi:hypothetical protein
MPRLRMSGVIPILPLYAFMVWYAVAQFVRGTTSLKVAGPIHNGVTGTFY